MRVIQNHTGIENRKYKLYQIKEALTDPQAWMLTAIALLQCIPGGGLTAVSNFTPFLPLLPLQVHDSIKPF